MDGSSNKIEISQEIHVLDERAQRKENIQKMLLEITKNNYTYYCTYVDNSGLDAIIEAEKKEKEAIIAFFSEDKENPIDQKYIENIKKILILNRDSRGIAKETAETLENAGHAILSSLEKRKQDAEKDIALFNELINPPL